MGERQYVRTPLIHCPRCRAQPTVYPSEKKDPSLRNLSNILQCV